MNYKNILIELENNIAILTINRPSKLNALNIDTINDLHKAIKTLGKNKEIQVILITGSGEKAFVAGADISEFAHFTIAEGAQLASEGQEKLFDLIKIKADDIFSDKDNAEVRFQLYKGIELIQKEKFGQLKKL